MYALVVINMPALWAWDICIAWWLPKCQPYGLRRALV
jgi:hypothetical protein